MIKDLLLPRTDAGVWAQIVIVTTLWLAAAIVVRSNRDWLLFVTGVALIIFGWFGLRSIH